MLTFAIIGAGRIGKVHARSIAADPRAELVLVADPVAGAATDLAGAFGASATDDVNAVFDSDVDAVVVGSPTRFHVEHILAAVQAGKAVLCEKPVDLDLARVDACLAAVGEAAHRVMVGFNRRFDPGIAEIKRRVENGEIGAPEQLSIISRDPAPPPAGYLADSGGIFRDMSIHDFDMARFLLGDVVAVHATGQHLDPDVDDEWDAASITLTGASGAVATVVNSRHCITGYDQRVEAFGALGSLRAENLVETNVRAYTATTSGAAGRYIDFFLDRYKVSYAAELDHFITAIETGAPPAPSLLDGRAALAIADAAADSARTGTTHRL